MTAIDDFNAEEFYKFDPEKAKAIAALELLERTTDPARKMFSRHSFLTASLETLLNDLRRERGRLIIEAAEYNSAVRALKLEQSKPVIKILSSEPTRADDVVVVNCRYAPPDLGIVDGVDYRLAGRITCVPLALWKRIEKTYLPRIAFGQKNYGNDVHACVVEGPLGALDLKKLIRNCGFEGKEIEKHATSELIGETTSLFWLTGWHTRADGGLQARLESAFNGIGTWANSEEYVAEIARWNAIEAAAPMATPEPLEAA